MNIPPNQSKKQVLYDGSCPMCSSFVGRIEDSSQKDKFENIDSTTNILPQELTQEDVCREIHVVDGGTIYKNAAAILNILEEYPEMKSWVRLARLPFVWPLLPIGYRVVALYRHLIFGPASRIFWLKVITGLGLISAFLLSCKLWLSSRFYPLTPILADLPRLPFPLDYGIFLFSIALLAAIVLKRRPQKLIFAFISCALVLTALDQSRWQPWFYQYSFMLAALGLYSWDYRDNKKNAAALNTCRLLVASVYLYSGLQKANQAFVVDLFPWLIDPIAKLLPAHLYLPLAMLGFLVPFFEIGVGVGLLTQTYRNKAVVLAVLLHLFILLLLGPFGHNWNSVVWPWNVVMALSVVLLFWKSEQLSFKDIVLTKNSWLHRLVLVLFGILPLLSFVNLWDAYLSSALYSGNIRSAVLYVNESVVDKLPAEVRRYATKTADNKSIVNIDQWSFGELNVPSYPETRIYKNIAKYICRYAANASDVVLTLRAGPALINKEGPATYDCSSL